MTKWYGKFAEIYIPIYMEIYNPTLLFSEPEKLYTDCIYNNPDFVIYSWWSAAIKWNKKNTNMKTTPSGGGNNTPMPPFRKHIDQWWPCLLKISTTLLDNSQSLLCKQPSISYMGVQ